MLPTLDARLAAAAELVRPGEPVADIGCDHGKLTAVLAASGKYPKVIGADLRPGPLAKAEQTLEHAGCKDRAELRLGDGLSVLTENEVGSIVLAGVSAQTTWEILEKAPWVFTVRGPRIIMIPATRHDALRRWLWEHGFSLCGRPPGAGGGPLVRGDGGGVHRRGCMRPPLPSACSAAQVSGPREKATPTGRRQSCPGCALAYRMAAHWRRKSIVY